MSETLGTVGKPNPFKERKQLDETTKLVVTTEEICERHGHYTSKEYSFSPGRKSGCPTCSEEYRKQQESEYHAEQRRRRIADHRKAAGIPARFAGCTFDNYRATSAEQKHALKTVQSYAEQFKEVKATGSCLTLCGGVGTGKTHLAVASANIILDAGYTVVYLQLAELIRAIRNTWNRNVGENETDVIAKFRNTDLLILDEVGVSFGTDNERNQLFDVLDGRYRDGRPSLLISNLNGKALEGALGERLYDRLVGESGNVVVIFPWKSYRPQVVRLANKPLPTAAASPHTVAENEPVFKEQAKADAVASGKSASGARKENHEQ